MARIIKLEKARLQNTIDETVKVLEEGGIVIYPTDTVYGIGGDATSPAVVEKVREIKGIEKEKPFSVIMADLGMIEEYCVVNFAEELILKKYLPGPYTFILKVHRPIAATTTLTLGVRIPEHAFCTAVCEKFKKPIVTTSANKTGEAPPHTFSGISREVLEAADLAIDAGQTKYEQPSVLVDLVEKKIIREGAKPIDMNDFLNF